MKKFGLQGTPLHVEFLRKPEEQVKQDKRSCEYYLGNNECSKDGVCYGGRYCTKYIRRAERTKKQLAHKAKEIEAIRNYETIIVTNEYNYIGEFLVKFLDEDEVVKFVVGETKEEAKKMNAELINKDAPLFKKVLSTEENHEFEIQGNKIVLLEKRINRYKIK